jgi:hypothetical protein
LYHYGISIKNNLRYVLFVVRRISSFNHIWLIIGLLTEVTWWVLLVEQELLTLLSHFSVLVRVAGSFVFCVVCCISLFVLLSFPVWCLKQELTILSTCSCIYFVVEATRCTWVHPSVFSGVRVTRSLVLCVMFCRSLFVLLFFFFWPLCCLSFDLWILITPFVFSNYFYSWHKRNLLASIKSSGFLIRNMLQSVVLHHNESCIWYATHK